LIADERRGWRAASSKHGAEIGYQTLVVDSGDAAIAMLTAAGRAVIDAVVLDLVMPASTAWAYWQDREAGLSIPVVVQTAMRHRQCGVAMRAGARFCGKPVGIERCRCRLRNALNTSALKGELQRIRHSREGRLTFAISSPAAKHAACWRTAQKAAASTIRC